MIDILKESEYKNCLYLNGLVNRELDRRTKLMHPLEMVQSLGGASGTIASAIYDISRLKNFLEHL